MWIDDLSAITSLALPAFVGFFAIVMVKPGPTVPCRSASRRSRAARSRARRARRERRSGLVSWVSSVALRCSLETTTPRDERIPAFTIPQHLARRYGRRVIADAHVDLLMELAYRERRLGETDVFARTWLPLLEQGGVGLQVCPIYVDVTVQPEGSLREALSMVASFHRAVAENADRVVQVRDAADLARVESGERLGLMLALEGVECFGVETWPADVFHALGVRMAGLTWNRRNAFADGAAEDGGGLSRLGRELVDRLVELGVVLDLAHASRGVYARAARAGGRRADPLLARRLPGRQRHAAEPRRRPAPRARATRAASSG